MEWDHKEEPFWDEYSQEFRCTLWGTEAWFHISYYNNGQDCRERLTRFAEAADRCLGWLNVHQAEIFAAIEADGLCDAALEAVEEMEMESAYTQVVAEDGVFYLLMDGGERLSLPYRKDDFFNSLIPGGLSFSADHKSTGFLLDLFLNLEPDIFAGHSVEIFLDGDFGSDLTNYTVTVNGLAG